MSDTEVELNVPDSPPRPRLSARLLRPLAWGALVYTIMVVLFGAWVRITGSGAGCGQHWPTCHGEIVPRAPSEATVIEFTHRLSSGIYGLVILALVVVALRGSARGGWARRGAALALVFTITEALVGARLVLFGLVADNDSIDRAIWMAIHLINTSLLTGAVAVTCWASELRRLRSIGRDGWSLAGALVALLLVGITGAVTALGDTLFPVVDGSGVAQTMSADHSPTAHFLQRLRVMHPILAVGVALYVLVAVQGVVDRHKRRSVVFWARWTAGLVIAQVAAGVINILLSAPGWLQIVHLLLANCLWIALIFSALSAASSAPQEGVDGS